MNKEYYIYFVYGMCFMFYGMMTWFFWCKRSERLSRLVMALMAIIAAQCLIDLTSLHHILMDKSFVWSILTLSDMVAVPFYAFILMELCRPGSVNARVLAVHLLPFLLLPVLFVATHSMLFYYIEVVWVTVYGVGCAVWTAIAIRRYNIVLHQQFSYDDNINLGWLKGILVFFFAILSLWVLDSIITSVWLECLYMLGSLAMWAFLAYFIYKHETVIGELKSAPVSKVGAAKEESVLAAKIRSLFDVDKVFLKPNLKLADIATMTGSNRTYVSRFFNDELQTTFFDFVNGYRVKYAKELLRTSSEKIDVIAEKCGYNSRQSFHRVFNKFAGTTPEQFRSKTKLQSNSE